MMFNHTEKSDDGNEADENEAVPNMHSINSILDISIDQNNNLIKE